MSTLMETKPGSPDQRRGALMAQARALMAAGICFIPTDRKTKSPTLGSWKQYQTRRPTMSEALEWFNCVDCAASGPDAIAVIGGAVSGHLECMDFDCEAVAFDDWKAIVEDQAPGLMERLVVLQTQSGGRHVLYRCAAGGTGCTKLAEHHVPWSADGTATYHGKHKEQPKKAKPYAAFGVIETKGEGGYFLTAPSDGYTLLQGKVAEPPLVTAEERSILLMAAAAQSHEYPEPEPVQLQAKQEPRQQAYGPTPMDAFNAQPGVAEVVLRLMQQHGWKQHGQTDANYQMTRPGKKVDDGLSATIRRSDGAVFNFSGNADALPEHRKGDKAESPAGVYALLEHGGDMKAATLALVKQGYGKPHDGTRLAHEMAGGGSQQAEPEPPTPWQPEHEASTAMNSLLALIQSRQGEEHVGIAIPGMPKLTEHLEGFDGYTLLSGDTGTGKTALSCGIALAVAGLRLPDPTREHADEQMAAAGSGVKVVYVASELGQTLILSRMLGVLSGKHAVNIRKGRRGTERTGPLRLAQMKPDAERIEAAWRALQRLMAAGHLTVLGPEHYDTRWASNEHCFQRLAEACERVRGNHDRMLVVVDSMDAMVVQQSGHGLVPFRDALSADDAKVEALQRWRAALGTSGALLLLQEESKAAAGTGSTHAGRGSSKLPYRADAVVQLMSARARDGSRPMGTLALKMREEPVPPFTSMFASPLDVVVNKARLGARGVVCVDFIPALERVSETGDAYKAHEIDKARAEWKPERKAATEKKPTEKKAAKREAAT